MKADLQFRTPVEIPVPLRQIGVGDCNIFLGSCFAEHIGGKFVASRLNTMLNPVGVLYNPLSIARMLTTGKSNPERDFVKHRDMWHTWLGDITLSRPSKEECQRATNKALVELHTYLCKADNLFITLGTTHCYIEQESGQVVANCHRLPADRFTEQEMLIDKDGLSLETALCQWHELNPRLQVVLTVSPYRYQKYGMHGSQLSKARLLLYAEELCQAHPEWICYFPAYELLLDELRDYRFYAEDMLHPSEQAVKFIWQRLSEHWMDNEVKTYLQRWEPLSRAMAHRPMYPQTKESREFQNKLMHDLAQLMNDYPMLGTTENRQ